MSIINTPRLMAAAKEFNIGTDTLIDYLALLGYRREDLKPTTKLTPEMYQFIKTEFSVKRIAKEPVKYAFERAEQLIKEASLKKVEKLNLTDIGLKLIPQSIVELRTHLKELYLGVDRFNILGNLNSDKADLDLSLLPSLAKLEVLHLTNFAFVNPEAISKLNNLRELILHGSSIPHLDFLKNLKRLRYLDISNIDVRGFSELEDVNNIETLVARNCLGLKSNMFQNISWKSLKHLDLSENIHLCNSIHELSKLKNLEHLRISSMGIDDLTFMPKLENLKLLEASGNGFRFADNLLHFKKLEHLNISSNEVVTFSNFTKFENLKTLQAQYNQIENVIVNGNSKLEEIDLAYNKVNDLIVESHNLVNLNLTRNQLSSLHIVSRSIKFLFLVSNLVKDISFVDNCPNLSTLDLSDNLINDISPIKTLLKDKDYSLQSFEEGDADYVVLNSQNLNTIRIYPNPVLNPPLQYLYAGKTALINYWDQEERAILQNEKKARINEAKIIIVGNSNVGKSTLCYYFKHGKFPNEKLASTHGMDFSTWKPKWRIGQDKISINVIDFGGQEYYHDTHHLFFNDKAFYLLLWSKPTNINKKLQTPVGDRSKFSQIRHFDIEYWLNAIEIYSKSMIRIDSKVSKSDSKTRSPITCPVLLVQTNVDIDGKQFLNMETLSEKYDQLYDSVSVSLINDSDNIEILDLTIKKMYQYIHKEASQEYFESWITFKKFIEVTYVDNYRIFDLNEFRDLYNNNAGSAIRYSVYDIKTLCITFNHWGIILYKYDIPELENFVIINPQKFTRNINILLEENLINEDGIISETQIIQKLAIGETQAQEVLQFLNYFKILFELPQSDIASEKTFVSPMYLNNSPKHFNLFLDTYIPFYKIVFEGYFHKGILLDCFKELGNNILFKDGHYFYWQWGMVLKKGSRIVYIEFDDQNLKHILIRTQISTSEKLGNDDFILEIFEAFKKITAKYKVQIELSLDGRVFFNRELIIKKLNYGLNKIEVDSRSTFLRDYLFLLNSNELEMPNKKIFISYSSKDRKLIDRVIPHLDLYKNSGSLTFWLDLNLEDREEWNTQIIDEMNKANIYFMFLSPNYFGTKYILENEVPIALKAMENIERKKQVFWILLEPCNYERFPSICKYQIYPAKELDTSTGFAKHKALSEYSNFDRKITELFRDILNDD